MAKKYQSGVFQGKETPNDYFIKQYTGRQVGIVDRARIYAADVTLEFSRLLENSVQPNPLDLIYNHADPGKPLNRTLYFVVADDTFVTNESYVVVALTENTCMNSLVSSPKPPEVEPK